MLNNFTMSDANLVVHSGVELVSAVECSEYRGGTVTVESGAVVTGISRCNAVINGTVTNAIVGNGQRSYIRFDVGSGGKLISATALQSGGIFVSSGGLVEDSILEYGWGRVYSGGSVKNMTLKGGDFDISGGVFDGGQGYGYLSVESGGSLKNLTLSGGGLAVRNATATDFTISDGSLGVYGGTATDFTLAGSASISFSVDPTDGTYISGTIMKGETPTTILIQDGKVKDLNMRGTIYLENGGTADNITFSGGNAIISSGCTATNLKFNGMVSGGGVYVGSYGYLDGAVFESGTGLTMSYYASAANVSALGGGITMVDTCRIDNALIANGGVMSMLAYEGDAPVAVGITLSHGIVTSTYHDSYTDVDSTWTEDVGGRLVVYWNAIVSDTTVMEKGEVSIVSNGHASNTTLSSGGFMGVSGYGKASGVTVSSGGILQVGLCGIATDVTVLSGGRVSMVIDPNTHISGAYEGSAFAVDGTLTSAIGPGFSYEVASGGAITAQTFALDEGGRLTVCSGATFQGDLTVNRGCEAYIYYGTNVSGTVLENGGWVSISNEANITFVSNTIKDLQLTSGYSATVHSTTVASNTLVQGVITEDGEGWAELAVYGGVVYDTDVRENGYLYVTSGGSAFRTRVSSNGDMNLYDSSFASDTIVSGVSGSYARMEVGYSCTAVSTTLKDSGGMEVWGLASSTTVSNGGILYVENGSAIDTVVHSGGTFFMSGYDYGSAFANNTIISSGGTLSMAADYFGVATASDTVVESGGVLYLDSPAVTILSGTVFKSGGSLAICEEYRSFSHDSAGFYDMSLESGASVTLHNSAIAYNPVLGENAVLELGNSGGASVVSATAAGATVRVLSGGAVESAFIGTGAVLDVQSGGWAYFTTIDGGTMRLNGIPIPGNSTYAYGYGIEVRNGTLSAGSGALVGLVSAGSGGRIELGSGAIATEQILLSDDAVLSADGGTVAFRLGYTPGQCIQVDDISRITGTPDYRLVVLASSQAYGEYVIATGAAAFDDTITIISDGSEDPLHDDLGTLTLGGESVQVGERWYSLMHPDDDAIAVVVTKRALSHDDGPDDGWNDYLYDKKKEKEGKPVLNPDIPEFEANILTSDVVKLNVDQMYTVYNKDSAGKLWYNFVGNGTVSGEKRADAADFALVHLDCGARLSFDLEATDATKFTVWSLTIGEDKKGNPTYTQKSLQATTLKKGKGATTYSAQTKNLFLEAGDYYISMQSTNIKKGGAAFYNVKLNQDETAKNYTVFYSDGDDGWNNYLYDKKEDPVLNPDRYDFPTTYVSSGTSVVRVDSGTSHTDEKSGVVYNNFVGFGDDTDFARVYLDYGASLSFTVDATDATKFTVWRLVEGEDKKGNPTYTQKNLQTTTLKLDKKTGLYSADSKPILLERGIYYVSVQSANAKKGGGAYYNVEVNQVDCTYYVNGDGGWNDWLYDKKNTSDPLNYDVYDFSAQVITEGNTPVYVDDWSIGHVESGITWDSFVGFGDPADFRKIRLSARSTLNFKLQATGAAKFTVWRHDEKEDKNGNTVYTQKSLQATTLKLDRKTGLYSADTKTLSLESGDYYVSMESTDAAKGGSAYYNVEVGSLTVNDVVASTLAMPEAGQAFGFAETCAGSATGLLASL